MAIEVTELVESREWRGNSIVLSYRVTGTDDDTTARTNLLSSAPSTYEGRVRQNPDLEPEWVDTTNSDGVWLARITYAAPQFEDSDVGNLIITADTSGGTQHLTQSLATIAVHSASGTPPDGDSAIGQSDDSIEGVDVVAPVFDFTATKIWASGSFPSLATIFSMTGKVNSATSIFTDSERGFSISLDAGECLFRGAQFGGVRADGAIEFRYSFSASPNRTGLTVGSMTGIDKKGWEYLWVRYEDTEDQDTLIKTPAFAYVEQVYQTADLNSLGVSSAT